jgi:AcrR family transcriptional regulator
VSEQTDRRARKKAQTRELIREVAHRLFAQQGFDVVTVVDIAR